MKTTCICKVAATVLTAGYINKQQAVSA